MLFISTFLKNQIDNFREANKKLASFEVDSSNFSHDFRFQVTGIEPGKLLATIEEYNLYCGQQYDEIFAKIPKYLEALHTPPYYAIEIHPRFIGTIGGIKINHHMEVLGHNDNPIRGLYAAGIDTEGWEGDTYNGIMSGSTLGFAINSGRIAGENAASLHRYYRHNHRKKEALSRYRKNYLNVIER